MSADMGEVTLSLVGQAWTLAVRDREGSVLSFEQGLSPTKAFSCVAQFCDTGSIGNTTRSSYSCTAKPSESAGRSLTCSKLAKFISPNIWNSKFRTTQRSQTDA